ncbi:MAG: Coq4 family protein [Myxococcota bacterium]
MASRNRIRPLQAMAAMRELRRNPDDTAAAIRVIAALAGNTSRRGFERFRRSERGARILRERQDLYGLLTDRDRLLAMPPGSLGRTLIDWFDREGISTEGLAQASEEARGEAVEAISAEEQAYGSRQRNLHDVFHVVTGYDRDLRGEAAVLAFTVGQTYHRGIAYLVWTALREEGWRSAGGRLIRDAYRRGRRAKPLLEQDWEQLFEQPIGEVRELLGVGAPPAYEQIRSAAAPAVSA